ncbi:MAG: M28 family peptidase [Promethearchaeota archaeon]
MLFKLNEDKQNIVILGTHYDSRAKATKDPDLINRESPIVGANDGASGSAVLIELAKVLYNQRDNLSCQIWFLFFDAEDQGRDNDYGIDGWNWCEGSEEFVSNIDDFYDSTTESFDCMILLDMVGGENLRFINEQYSTSSLLNELFAVGRQLGYTNQFPSNPEAVSIIDDHKPFSDIGISSADLIINFWDNSGWPYHHTTQDDIIHISNSSLDVTGKTLEQFIYNNYINDSENSYQGNFPWTKDKNILSMDILITIIIIIIFACVIIELFIITKNETEKSIEPKK